MSKAGKITAAISGAFLLLIVVAIILIATFDWNRLKPTINQKVSAELNRPFAIRGDLGVVWERQKQETGWRSWVPWPHVHAEDIILGNPPDIPEVTMVHLPRVEATLAPLALLTKTVWLPWIKLEKPDARLIRLSEKNNNWTFNLANDDNKDANQARVGLFELDPRQPDRFGQQRQRGQRRFYSRQMHHCDFGNIRWIAKNDVFRVYMGPRHPTAPASFLFLPLPHHAQIATDSERTIQLRRDFLVDGRFESIPVKSCNQNDRYDNQQQESP